MTLRDSLCERIRDPRRSDDELRVVDLLLGGIELHAPEYGPADVNTDLRDLTDELDAELTDGLFYILLRAVKRRARRLAAVGEQVPPAAHVRLESEPGSTGPTGNEAADAGQWRETIEDATERRRDELEADRSGDALNSYEWKGQR